MIDDFTVVPAFPTVVNIETTNRCNLKCVICPRLRVMNRPVGDMAWPLFKRVIDEIATASSPDRPLAVGLHLFGEPLLHPDLLAQIAYAKAALPQGTLYLSTNVTLLRPALADQLAASGLDWIVLSVDGATAKTYERVRHGASFTAAVSNVRGFLEAVERRRADHMQVWVQLIAADEDLDDEVEQFQQFWRPWEEKLANVRVAIKPLTDWAGQVPLIELASEKANVPRPGKCRRVVEQLNVYWNGEVTACCYDVDALMIAGNLATESLSTIWHGSQMDFLREAFQKGQQRRLPLCRTCRDAD